ncbi:3'(2'),5'-bisphosphate nucleotidase CysQ [candidate division KSB1 bacterium]|nr:3'(2'),5'-bisphosphate nucleotidase CysQ [candidate division KSB1 bacterium]
MELKKTVDDIVALSRLAGEQIMTVYKSVDFGIERKDDNSPLTIADKKANELITNHLRRNYPDCGILAEESRDTMERLQKKHVWIVDPLDGTKEFIKRNGEFTVNIALVENGKPILGVVYVPVSQEVYYGAAGCGAYYRCGDTPAERIRCSDKTDIPSMILVKSRSHAGDKMQRIQERYSFADVLECGSSIKICKIAIGKADVYFRFGLTSEWDICAAHCVLTEAGGRITDCPGDEIVYNRTDILNRNGFIASNGTIHVQFVDIAKNVSS